MKILLTGGTGLIGRHLIPRLHALHHEITVVTRSPEKARQVLGAGVDIWKGLAEQQNLDGFDAVINLAGEPIADRRWTEEQKQRLCSSRWTITEAGRADSQQPYAAIGAHFRLCDGLLRRSRRSGGDRRGAAA